MLTEETRIVKRERALLITKLCLPAASRAEVTVTSASTSGSATIYRAPANVLGMYVFFISDLLDFHPHFTDKEIEVLGSCVTCLISTWLAIGGIRI